MAYIGIICAYSLALFWTLLPVVGWSYYDYEGTGVSCSIKWEEQSLNVTSYNMTILVTVYLVPVIIMIVVNVKVYLLVRNHNRENFLWNKRDANTKRKLKVEHEVAKTVIFIIGGFLLAWSPYACVVFVGAFINPKLIPPIVGTTPAIFAKTSLVYVMA
ncbi:unnamed protein product [Didymodactylos carnosus]|uniref:G-protein coupled receptors family 1 profile domain-containing protein n=1 Tax=Didymodactylos carnosus TaxID=1234261 RepID=A0A814N3F8_9BILA|nr:unnamed protein product [Didymodactylos carnosus]CAF1087830.1 unnamed protein product [Didymodactylos carnosus]CAF3597761.1 unnamed protein product [Didymodactylos carnosus]CAF3853338.1 unnamed protein product [Didymodactylos carnosus]